MASAPLNEILRVEFERIFDLDALHKLTRDLLGLSPEDIAAGAHKVAYVRALVDHCVREDMHEALADAALLTDKSAEDRLRPVYEGRVPEEIPMGTVVAGFKITKKLNDEGFGTVYLAAGEGGRQVSLKVLREGRVRDKRALHRFLLAQRALKAIDHPAVQKPLSAGVLPDSRPYIAAEYLDGQYLSTRLGRAGAMHINEARHVLQALCDGLDKVHAAGLAHADIRPDHVVLVRKDGALSGVLVDFAVDRMASGRGGADGANLLMLMGSARALAPERIRAGSQANARSDVYSLGALAYEMLTAKPVFASVGVELLVAHVTQTPEAASKVAPRGWVTKDLDVVLLKALAKDPEERYPSAGDFLRAVLEAIKSRRTGEISREDFEARKLALAEASDNEEKALELEHSGAQGIPWVDVATVFMELAEGATDAAAKRSLRYRAARVLEAEAKDLAAARAVYQKIVDEEPGEELAKAKVQEIRRCTATSEERAEILLEEVETETLASDRARLLSELAKLYEREIHDEGNALVAITQALSEAPEDDDYAREVERLAGDDPAKWSEVLTTMAEGLKDKSPEAKTELLLRLGRWYQDKVQRTDFALGCYTQAISLTPGNDPALEGAASLYRKGGQWSELCGVLLKRADVQTVTQRGSELRAEAAEILETKLNDGQRARDLAEKVLADDPAQPRAYEIMERALLKESDWKALVGLLDRKVAVLVGGARAEALNELAEVYEDRLSDTQKAAEYFALAHEADTHSLSALKGLERIHAREGNHEKLLKALEGQRLVAQTPRQRVELAVRVAALIEEEFVDHARAAGVYEEALAIDAANDPALSGLARLYKVLKRWDELVAVLEKHALLVEDPPRRVELLLSRGRVLLEVLGGTDKAQRCFEQALEGDKSNAVALESLAKIAALKGDMPAAAERYDALLATAKDPAAKTELLLRAGRVFEDNGDRERAIERYKQVLDLAGDSAIATGRLKELYAARGDAAGAIEMLHREIEAAEGSSQRASLWVQVAKTYRDRIKDREKARDAAQKATLLDPSHDEGLSLLGDFKFDEGAYAEAAELMAPRAQRARDLERGEGLRVVLRYGEALARAGESQKALEAFRTAKDIAPGEPEVLKAVAHATYVSEVWSEAVSCYEIFLASHGKALSPEARLEALREYGDAARRSGDTERAVKALHEAHELAPENLGVMDLCVQAHTDEGRWDEVVRFKRKKLELAGTDAARHEINVEMAELLATKLGEKAKAARTYVAALEHKPEDRKILTRLMQLYSEEKDWGRLVEIVLRLADLVDDRTQLARYYLTAAQLCEVHLGRVDEAIDYYELALEQDPSVGRALESLGALRAGKKDYPGLEQSYKRVLGKLPEANKAMRARLQALLGELYETHLKQPAEAVSAYEKAMELAPSEYEFNAKLAELYLTDSKKYFDKAVAVHRAMLVKDPMRTESLHALRRVYTEAKKPDQAWCLCQALVGVKAAVSEEENFYKKFRTDRPAVAQEKLTEERWTRELNHPMQDGLLTAVFATITPAVLKARGIPLEKYNLGDATEIDPANDSGQMAQTLHYAAGVFGMKLPPVHALPSDEAGVSFALSDPPALFLGATALQGGPTKAMAFIGGARLSYFRHGHLVRQLAPTGTGLRAWLFAAMRAVQPTFPVTPELAGPVNENVESIKKHLTGTSMEVLTSHVTKLLAGEVSLDLKRWTLGVDLTSDRAGFLLCNDLAMALAVIRATPEDSAPVPQSDRVRELRQFAISEEYFTLRQRLGIAMVAAASSPTETP